MKNATALWQRMWMNYCVNTVVANELVGLFFC